MTAFPDIPVAVEMLTGNVPPLLHEIRHALIRVANGQAGTTIDLRSLPLAPGEELRIEAALGTGEVRAEFDALGPSVVQETAFPGVWLVTHRNPEQEIVGRFIEVTRMPEVLHAQQGDIEAGIGRLEAQLANDAASSASAPEVAVGK
jgi:hydrogenase-1 operon protein HyaF